MRWPEQVVVDRSSLLPPAESHLIEKLAKQFAVAFPQEYIDFLLWADGGVLPGRKVIVYSVGQGVHPAETLIAANENRPADFPLFLVARDAFEEFGFLRSDLRAPQQACAVYIYFHETQTVRKVAESFREFIQNIVKQNSHQFPPPRTQ